METSKKTRTKTKRKLRNEFSKAPGCGSGCLGVQLWAPGRDSGRLRVQLFYCNFPRVVLGSHQLSTIDIYIPNRSPRRKLSNAI
ncbi:hypothetical protein PIB30_080686 [Stylosanthes scabra]|uniref:Uncharacterized protein n=1 Tax=Stylosanthes scabra TaxID=79078 RepID=A0ABU6SRQ3_9FABA|nr:hypothetical protein [Stylosanthes scabra]